MLVVGFASVCSITVSSLRYTYSVRVELNHLFYFFLKGNVFIEESGKRMGWWGGHTSPARCAKSMLMISLENNVLF